MVIRIILLTVFASALFACIDGPAAAANHTLAWNDKRITLSYHPTGSFDGIKAAAKGHDFTPMAGGGIVINYNGKMIGPTDYKIVTTSTSREGEWLVSAHRAQIGNESVPYTLRVSLFHGIVRIKISSDSPYIRGVCPGDCQGAGAIRSLPVNRYGEQQGWGTTDAYWLDDAKLWAKGSWDLVHGNYSQVGCELSDSSKRALFEGLTYLTRLDGSVAPLRETLCVRFNRDLWKTVPKLDNPPTPFAADLRKMTYLDTWDDPFVDCQSFLRHVEDALGGYYKFYTTFHTWQGRGYDQGLPNAMPPNEALGGVKGLESVLQAGREIGYIGLHNNYTVTGSPGEPSVLAGMKPLLGINGKPIAKLDSFVPKSCTLVAGAGAVEPSIHALGTNGVFLDELGAGGIAHTPGWYYYLDFDRANPNGIMMRDTIECQRKLALLVKSIHKGPLGTETGISEYLAGYVDVHDYGVINGYRRVLLPDYKLRRLQTLEASYGMGLYYRYFGDFEHWTSPGDSYEIEDSYRAAQIMYGNGAYIFWYKTVPSKFIMTEIGLVGTMQPYYMFQTVKDISYLVDGKSWLTIAEIVERGLPYDVRRPVREVFDIGYTQIINRTDDAISVQTAHGPMTLPKDSFVAWSRKTGLWAFSAFAPGTSNRIDYAIDPSRKVEFVNPRDGE